MDSHKAERIVITCIDFRLQEHINNWIARNFQPKTFDRVALAGGVRNLNAILEQIDIAVRLHHIKKVVLINHQDCGAYGQENFPDSKFEHNKHALDLKNAKEKINERFTELGIDTYFLHLDGHFEPIS